MLALFILEIAPLSCRTAPVGLDAGSLFLRIAPLSSRTARVGLDSKNEPDHETVAFFGFLKSKNEPEHETVAFCEDSRQQKRAGPRDCCIF